MSQSFDYDFVSDNVEITSEGVFHEIPSGGNLTLMSEFNQPNHLYGEFHYTFFNKSGDNFVQVAPSAGTVAFQVQARRGFNWLTVPVGQTQADNQQASETDYSVPTADVSFIHGRAILENVAGATHIAVFVRRWGS